MQRQKGKKGFSDRVWPNYDAWLDYSAKTVQRMADPERRAKEVDRLAAFAISVGRDEAWEKKFRASVGREYSSPPGEQSSPPRERNAPRGRAQISPGVGNNMPPRTESLIGSFKRRSKQVLDNGPESEQAPLRASPSFSPSQDPERPKSTAREKQKADLVKFFQAEFSTANGVKPLDEYLEWFPTWYGREDIEWAYLEASGLQAGAT